MTKPVSLRQLAEMLLFDCRFSTDNQQALDRIAECIQQYIDNLVPAQPEQEPVIFCMHWEDRWGVNHYVDPKEPHPAQAKPLYTNPPAAAQPAQQEPYGWVQPNPSFNSGIFNQGSACPSGWVGSAIDVYTTPTAAQTVTCNGMPAYEGSLSAAQRKPLTNEQIVQKAKVIGGLFDDLAVEYQTDDIIKFGREMEATHGIKEKT